MMMYLCLQILDLGIILHPGSYLREFWNIMDAVVVICAAVSFGFNLRLVNFLCITVYIMNSFEV